MAASARSAAFVIPHPYVDALACFREPIRYLACAGWQIDLYTALSPMHPVPFFGHEGIRIVPLSITRAGAIDLVRRLILRRPKYDYLVTVPQWGLHYSAVASRLSGVPMGCISDELKAAAEAKTDLERLWKSRERRAHRRCRWTMALSPERADFIRRENQLGPEHRIFTVPNASAGQAQRTTSHYFHDVLSLPPRQRILVHAGSLWWQGITDVVESAESWTSDWTVVFQIRFAANRNGWRDSTHVRFATGVLPASLLDYAISSATIGLALYDASKVNNRLMGTASGKVALYMKNGLPVIATRDGGFDWIEREECGACISHASEIPAAADRIWAKYDDYSANVRRRYDETMEFSSRFRPVAEFMAAQ